MIRSKIWEIGVNLGLGGGDLYHVINCLAGDFRIGEVFPQG
jgi:hypothetical protein